MLAGILQPPVVGVVAALLLYWLGGRGGLVGRRERSERRWRTPLFVAGLATTVVATSGPVDRLADRLFWAHMVQHVLLIEVAAPLVVLGRPWSRLWRPFPLGLRRAVAGGLSHHVSAAPARLLGRALAVPAVAFVLLNGGLVVWHVPAFYDAALASQPLHDVEHAVFFLTAVLLWSHLLGGGPMRVRLALPWRATYAVGSMVVGWALAVVLADSAAPLYSHYAELATRPGGISALTDQQLAAGVMWVPGAVPWAVVCIACAYGWLNPDRRRGRWLRRAVVER